MTQAEPVEESPEQERFATEVYTPIEEAAALLRERQALEVLPELEHDGLLSIPEVLQDRPVALIGRQLSTPNHEMARFLDLASGQGLQPVFWEYHSDKFVARNAVKHARGRLGFFKGVGRNGGLKIEYVNVIDFVASEGLPMRNVRTLWGQSWIDFHHELLLTEYPQLSRANLFDASGWFAEHGGSARSYYRAFMMLFLRHAIWFEWFLLNDEERAFTTEVIWPAFRDVHNTYGVKPLIVALDDAPGCVCENNYWKLYPEHLHEGVARMAKGFKSAAVSAKAPATRDTSGTSPRDRTSGTTLDSTATASEEHELLAQLVYTPLEEAVELLRFRQSENLFGELEQEGLFDPPAAICRPNVAVMFRQLATPNHELRRFLALCSQHGLTPVIWEYHADKFVDCNPLKYAWGRMGFYGGRGRNGGLKLEYVNVIDMTAANGVPLCDVKTRWQQSLIEFHHDLLFAECPELNAGSVFDGSCWLARNGGAARNYYRSFIALFLRHAILFETFLLEGDELKFLREIFLPAFYDVYSTFGVKPLITPIDPLEREGDSFWQFYPGHMRRHLLHLADCRMRA